MSSFKTYLVDIDRETGNFISGFERIKQSIRTILLTRTFTRVMRLWWGSNFQEMIDKPINQETIMNGIVAAIRAVNKYEPEFQITNVEVVQASADGSATIRVIGVDLIQNQARTVALPLAA